MSETKPCWQTAIAAGSAIPQRKPERPGVTLTPHETFKGRETVAMAEAMLTTLALDLECDGTATDPHCRLLQVAEACRAFGVTLAKSS